MCSYGRQLQLCRADIAHRPMSYFTSVHGIFHESHSTLLKVEDEKLNVINNMMLLVQVLYRMFDKFSALGIEQIGAGDVVKAVVSFVVVLLGSSLIGLVCGLLGSASTRFTHHATLTEPLLLYFLSYLAYIAAELFHLSGILASVHPLSHTVITALWPDNHFDLIVTPTYFCKMSSYKYNLWQLWQLWYTWQFKSGKVVCPSMEVPETISVLFRDKTITSIRWPRQIKSSSIFVFIICRHSQSQGPNLNDRQPVTFYSRLLVTMVHGCLLHRFWEAHGTDKLIDRLIAASLNFFTFVAWK